MRISSKYWLPAAVLGVGLMAFLALVAARPKQQPLQPTERVWYVETVQAEPQRLSPILTLYGQVENPDLLKAAAPGKGRVQEILAREGDLIAPGQLLLKLDPRDFQPRLLQAEAQVAELAAMIKSEELRHASDLKSFNHEKKLLELSRAGVRRAEQMKMKNLGSAAALDEAQEALERQELALAERKLALDDHGARLQQLNARLDHARADLELARLDLERTEIHAPFEGFVAKVHVAAGDQVEGSQLLLTLYPAESLEVRAKIPAPYQSELQLAVRQGDSLDARAEFAGAPLSLKLDRLSGEADPRGIDALFTFVDGADRVRLGAVLSLAVQRPPRDRAVPLPYSALYGDNRIYKLVEGRLKGIAVERLGEYIDPRGESLLLVSSPEIKAGDSVVVTRLPNAMSGLRAEGRERSASR